MHTTALLAVLAALIFTPQATPTPPRPVVEDLFSHPPDMLVGISPPSLPTAGPRKVKSKPLPGPVVGALVKGVLPPALPVPAASALSTLSSMPTSVATSSSSLSPTSNSALDPSPTTTSLDNVQVRNILYPTNSLPSLRLRPRPPFHPVAFPPQGLGPIDIWPKGWPKDEWSVLLRAGRGDRVGHYGTTTASAAASVASVASGVSGTSVASVPSVAASEAGRQGGMVTGGPSYRRRAAAQAQREGLRKIITRRGDVVPRREEQKEEKPEFEATERPEHDLLLPPIPPRPLVTTPPFTPTPGSTASSTAAISSSPSPSSPHPTPSLSPGQLSANRRVAYLRTLLPLPTYHSQLPNLHWLIQYYSLGGSIPADDHAILLWGGDQVDYLPFAAFATHGEGEENDKGVWIECQGCEGRVSFGREVKATEEKEEEAKEGKEGKEGKQKEETEREWMERMERVWRMGQHGVWGTETKGLCESLGGNCWY